MSGRGRPSTLQGNTGNVGAPSLEDQINALGFGRFQWIMLSIFGLLVVADGMELVVISILYMALKDEWGISEVEEGYLAGVIFVGVLIGNLVGGYLGDTWGRRNTVLFSGVFFVAAAAASAFAPDVITLAICRMLVGFAIGCKLPVATSICMELCPTESRGKAGMLIVGIAFSMGQVFACLVAMVVLQVDHSHNWWRWVLLGCALPDVFGVPLGWVYMPESPHLLLSQGRHEELSDQIKEVARINGKEGEMLQGGRVRQLVEEADVEKWHFTAIFSPQLLGTTVFCSVLWIVCAVCYHGHVFVYPLVLEQRYHMQLGDALWAVALAGAAEIPGVLIGMWLIDTEGMGRKVSTVVFFAMACVTSLCVPLLTSPRAFLAANMLLKTLINAPFVILYVFASELYPTTHRASGIAFCSSTSRVAGSVTPVLLVWCLAQSVTLTYQVIAAILGVGLAASLLYGHETLHTSLKTFAFEGDEGGGEGGDEERTPLKSSTR